MGFGAQLARGPATLCSLRFLAPPVRGKGLLIQVVLAALACVAGVLAFLGLDGVAGDVARIVFVLCLVSLVVTVILARGATSDL